MSLIVTLFATLLVSHSIWALITNPPAFSRQEAEH